MVSLRHRIDDTAVNFGARRVKKVDPGGYALTFPKGFRSES
jgi:hypothetical protein